MKTKFTLTRFMNIIGAFMVFISFFLPWVGDSFSALGLFSEAVKYLSDLGHSDPETIIILSVILSVIALPICSIIIIIYEFAGDGKRKLRAPKIIMLVVMLLFIIGLLIFGSKTGFTRSESVFSLFGAGFYFSFLFVIGLFIVIFRKELQPLKTDNRMIRNDDADTDKTYVSKYCPYCGLHIPGEARFCNQCGSKIE
jgi:hypothetical protein